MTSGSADFIAGPELSSAPQTWDVTVINTRFYWYDLLVGTEELPDFRDPVGRYLRRLQFALDATMESRLLFYVVTRPQLRFDDTREPHWGFFSLKLSLTVLVGVEQKPETIVLAMKQPKDATLKKPNIRLTPRYVTFDWGGVIHTHSVHELLQIYDTGLEFPSTIQFLGQTKDPEARLAKGKLASVERIRDQNLSQVDTFLMVQRLNILSSTDEPSEMSMDTLATIDETVAELLKQRMDVIESVLINYFEGPLPVRRSVREVTVRRDRLRELQQAHNLQGLRIDLAAEDPDAFDNLLSEHAVLSQRHIFDCQIIDGEPQISRLPDDFKAAH